MRAKEIVKGFGEYYVAQVLQNLGFEVDILDAEGIDLAAYKGEQRYGISVKSRCVHTSPNNTINLTYNDLHHTYEQSNRRGLMPAYAFVINTNEKIDILISTQESTCLNHLGVESLTEYLNTFSSKKDSGSTKSINISEKSRSEWKNLGYDGLIYVERLQSIASVD